MALVRSKDTLPELLFRRALWRAGLKYRIRKNLPGTPDIVFVRGKVALFVDGCFWHGCRRHYSAPVRNAAFWQRKLAMNTERDRRVDKELRRSGWRVARLWEHDIRENAGATIKKVRTFVCSAGRSMWRRSASPLRCKGVDD
jgi:DNA mismatch endonuclease (patch repair protein)